MLAETVRSCGPYATASVVPPGGLRKALRIETRRQLCAGGKRLRTRGPRYMADAFETILVAWLAFAFLPERPTRSQGGTDGSNPLPSSRQSVSRPDPAAAGRKTRGSARVCVAGVGRDAQGLVEIARSGAVISVGRYSSTAVPVMSSGSGGPRPGPSSCCGQFLKQSRAGRVARARPAADVSGRAACLP